MIPIPKKSAPVLLVVLLLILAAVFIIPRSSGDTVKAPFGEWRVEIIGTDCCGNTIMMQPSGILGNALEFTKDGSVIEDVTIKIYATATGNGFDACEFDFSNGEWDKNCPKILSSVWYGNTQYNIATELYDGDTSLQIPLGEETLIMEQTCTLADLFANNPEFGEQHTYSFEFQSVFTLKECTFRGISSNGNGPWKTEYVSFAATSDINLDWAPDDPCGDGTCEEQPYPGENCMTCSEDCGTCNGRILPSDREFTVEDSSLLGKDSWDIQRTYYTGSDWYGWSQGNTNWEHVEVFKNSNTFCAYVWPYSGAVGATLNGQCRVRELGDNGNILSGWFNLPQVDESWNDLGGTITSSDISTGVTGVWETDWREDHRLTHNGRYEMEVYYWLSNTDESPDPDPPGSSPVVNAMTVPPIPDGSTTGIVMYEVNDADDSTVDTVIDWGESTTSYSNEQTSSQLQHNFEYSQSYINSHAGVSVEIIATDDDGNSGSDTTWIGFADAQLSILSFGTYELESENSDFGSYEYDGRSLGT